MSYKSGFFPYFLSSRKQSRYFFLVSLRLRRRRGIQRGYLQFLSFSPFRRFGRWWFLLVNSIPSFHDLSKLRAFVSASFIYFQALLYPLFYSPIKPWSRKIYRWYCLSLIGAWFSNIWLWKTLRIFLRFFAVYKRLERYSSHALIKKLDAKKRISKRWLKKFIFHYSRRYRNDFDAKLRRFSFSKTSFVPKLGKKKKKKWTRRFCVLTYKLTKTNVYVTVSNLRGDVMIARSAGSLGLKKRWERHFYDTFSKLLDICLKFVKKRRLAKHVRFFITSYKKSFSKMLEWKVRSHRLRYERWIFAPKRVHGLPLRFRRLKRL